MVAVYGGFKEYEGNRTGATGGLKDRVTAESHESFLAEAQFTLPCDFASGSV